MRRLFRAAPVSVSAGGAAAVVILILTVSYFRHDSVSFGSGTTTVSVQALRGKVAASWRTAPAEIDTGGWRWDTSQIGAYTLEDEFDHARLGFAAEKRQHHYRDGRPIVARKVLFRLDALTALLVGLALAPLVTRRFRHVRGRCRKCGYSIEGTAARCPECGCPTGSVPGSTP